MAASEITVSCRFDELLAPAICSWLFVLLSVMNDASADARLRVDAAKALLSAKVRRAENGGKKEAKQEAAKQVASKFAQTTPPKLVASGGKKI